MKALKSLLIFSVLSCFLNTLYAGNSLTVTAQITQLKCYGDTNGIITLSATGGVQPYQYKLLGVSSFSSNITFSNLREGSYSAIVMDADSNIGVLICLLQGVDNIYPSASTGNGTPAGTSGGAIDIISTGGGTPPYSYKWSDGNTSPSRTNLSQGNYILTITDINNCSNSLTYAITDPKGMSVGFTSFNSTVCYGDSSGSVSLAVSGGQPPYSFQLSDGETNNGGSFNNLPAGNYSLTVTDANQGLVILSIIITQPPAPFVISSYIENVSACDSGNYNGQIIVTAMGGEQPYYFGYGFTNIQDPDSLAPGTYFAFFFDSYLCSSPQQFNVNSTVLCGHGAVSNVSCYGANDGSIIENVTGGAPPYTFQLNGGPATGDNFFSGLAPGDYSIEITDSNGLVTYDAATITQPLQINIADTVTNVSSSSAPNGTITLLVTGGTSPYSYAWQDGDTSSSRQSLTTGTYIVSVTDSNSCMATDTFTVKSDSGLLAITGYTMQQLCSGTNISISVTGGTPPYYYYWSVGEYTPTVTLEPTLYLYGIWVEVIDSVGNYTYQWFINTSYGGFNVQSNEPFNVEYDAGSGLSGCNNKSGAIQLTTEYGVAPGIPPFSYNWSNGDTTETVAGLAAGIYNYTVTDSLGCSTSGSVSISPGNALFLSTYSTSATCGESDGNASVNANDGIAPYSYNWSNGDTTYYNPDLAPGTYKITVTDQSGCPPEIESVTVGNQPGLTPYLYSPNQPSCRDSSGSLYVEAENGTSPYTYTWSNGDTGSIIQNLIAGTYYVTVQDKNACATTDSIILSSNNYDALNLQINSVAPLISCGGSGSLTILVSGGTGPFNYSVYNYSSEGPSSEDSSWSVNIDSVQINLPGGCYGITVTDSNGCTGYSNEYSLGEELSVSCTSQNTACYASTGSVTASAGYVTWCQGGGAFNAVERNSEADNVSPEASASGPGFSYLWSTGDTTQTVTGLGAGSYYVTVTDSAGCTAVVSGPVTVAVNNINIDYIIQDPPCRLGSIAISAYGGTAPYTYFWSNGAVSSSISDLYPGSYSITVTDSNRCQYTNTFYLSNAGTNDFDVLINTTPTRCGLPNGTATASNSLFYYDYDYSVIFEWSNGATNISSGYYYNGSTISNLSTGVYSVTATDEYGCTASAVANVGSIPSPVLSFSSTTPTCNDSNGTVTVYPNLGATPYSYSWQDHQISQTDTGLAAGVYAVTVTDDNGCSVSGSTTLVGGNVAPAITFSGSTAASCGLANGSVYAFASSSAYPDYDNYTFHWSNEAQGYYLSIVPAGTYTVTATDPSGCTGSASFTISSTDTLQALTFSNTNPGCGVANGSITVTPSGGVLPYNYSWSNQEVAATDTGLVAGPYSVTVKDANGCSGTETDLLVGGNVSPTIAFYGINGATCGLANGSVSMYASSSAYPYTYSLGNSYDIDYTFRWSNGAQSENLINVLAGTYTVTATDPSGCTATDSVTIPGTGQLILNFNVTNACVTTPGSITVVPSGGTPSYTYSWQTQDSTPTITGLFGGTYYVTVTDTHGCSAVDSATLLHQTLDTTSVSITVYPSDTISQGTNAVFTANGIDGGLSPQYRWIKNGSIVSTGLNPTYADATLSDGDVITCIMISSAYCVFPLMDTAAPINMFVYVVPSVSLIADGQDTVITGGGGGGGNNNGGGGDDGGGGGDIWIGGGSCYWCGGEFDDGDNEPEWRICEGSSVIFTATPFYGGDEPSYQWYLNGEEVGEDEPTYTIDQPATGDEVWVEMTSSAANAIPQTVKSAAITIDINAPAYSIVAASICQGETYEFDGNTYSAAGEYVAETLASSQGCDSLVILQLTVNQPTSSIISVHICDAASYSFNGQVYDSAGVYTIYTVNSAGCDSIITLELIKNQAISNSINVSICNGQPYLFNGNFYSTTGIYTANYTSVYGCDSIVTLNLSVLPYLTTNISESIREGSGYNFNGLTLTASGIYTDTLKSIGGCDSIITLVLNVLADETTDLTIGICPGSVYIFDGRILASPGTYTDTLIASSGADSIVTLKLSVGVQLRDTMAQTICYGDSFGFDGTNYTSTGFYSDTLLASGGCDSIVVLYLTVLPPLETIINQSICTGTSYLYNGHSISTTGTYRDTLISAGGCDSILILNLEVLPQISDTITIIACHGSILSFAGKQLSATDIYTDTLTSSGGCDSVVYLNFTVLPPVTDSIVVSICASSTYNFAGQILNQSGTYVDTLKDEDGCDSIVTLSLTVLPPSADTIYAGICFGNSYTFKGQLLSVTGTYNDTLTGSNGCDSMVTLNLTILPVLSSSFSAGICSGSSYNFNGHILNAAGIYKDTLTSSNGCDSIVSLNLSIVPQLFDTITAAICQGTNYSFGDKLLALTGAYTDSLVSSGGCDSIITLNLTVLSNSDSSLSAAICAGSTYTFDGKILSSTGIYSDTLTSSNGCDSIVTLNLSVLYLPATNINDTICQGTSYSFNGRNLTATGIYADTLTGTGGCDSVVLLHLQVNNTPVSTIVANGPTTFCRNDSVMLDAGAGFSGYLWNNMSVARSISVTNSGSYYCTVTLIGCEGVSDTITITVNNHPSPVIMANGPTTFCPGGEVTLDAGAGYSNYLWNYQSDTSQIIDVTQTGGYYCIVTLAGCQGSSDTINVISKPITAGFTTTINNNRVSFTNTSTNAATYLWNFGDGDTSTVQNPTHTYNGGRNYTVILAVTNGSCSIMDTQTIVTGCHEAEITGEISGPADVCAGSIQTYTAQGNSYTYSYTWIVSDNCTIVSGQGTNNIAVKFQTGFHDGIIRVFAKGCAGYGTERSLNIINRATPAAGITGLVSDVCGGTIQIYSVAPVNGVTTYTWSVTGAQLISGQGTDSIAVYFQQNYNAVSISVQEQTACGISTPVTIEITSDLTIGNLVDSTTAYCAGSSRVAISIPPVPGANSYYWTTPVGIVIASGQGTTSIRVNIDSAFTQGNVSVYAINSCTNGSVKSFLISAKPEEPAKIIGPPVVCSNTEVTDSVRSISYATSYTWTVPKGWIIDGASDGNKITFTPDQEGGYIAVTANNECGSSMAFESHIGIIFCEKSDDITDSESDILNEMKVFPNPFGNQFEIIFEASSSSNIHIRIYSIEGQLLRELNQEMVAGTNQIYIDLGDAAAGIYILDASYGNETKVLRMVKE